MLSIAVWNMRMTELISVVPGMKVSSQYYRDVLLSQQMLIAIEHVAELTFGTVCSKTLLTRPSTSAESN